MTPGMDRRTLLRTAGIAGLAGIGGATVLAATPASAAPSGFPEFEYLGEPLDMDNLDYNPTKELIFPCIRRVGGRISEPRADWYLYYAPHNDPGGICLAYADSLTGTFTEYPDNPVIPNDWAPHYSVPHVSSPHAYYNAADRHIYLYFHGDNTTTRVARSANGVDFEYVGAVVTTEMMPAGVTESSYARVFDHPTKTGTRIMLLMGAQSGTRKIFIGWSDKLTSGWRVKPEPLLSPGDGEGGQLSGAHYWSRDGGGHVVYHSASGNIHVADVGLDFDRAERLGVLHSPLSGAPDNGRAAAPSFAEDDGRLYMFYEGGQRDHTRIALAGAV